MEYLENNKVVSLSGKALTELLKSVHDKGAEFRFKAIGMSMVPSIHNNDILTLSPLRGILPFPGEVVAFRHPLTSNLIIHRITKANKNVFTIKGDNLKMRDSKIPLKNIIGVVIRVERQGRSIFWPHRFQNRIRAKIYFRFYLIYLMNRRGLKSLLRFFSPGSY